MTTSKNIVSLLSGQYNAQNYYLTVNEIAEQLSVLCSAVEHHNLSDPPAPTEGSSYILSGTPTGDWEGYGYHIAHYYNGSWHFYVPCRGTILYSLNDHNWHYWDGSSWGLA